MALSGSCPLRKDDRTMRYLATTDSDSKPDARPADQTDASPLTRAAFATGLAQAAFGAAYAPPDQANFCDKSPAEVSVIRALMWPGAAT